jgi:tripartite-type tricarboxylate transporter receptor subunit TctC
MYPNLAYDPATAFAPVSLIAMVPNVLLVGPSVHAKSVKELIELARSKPGKLTFASAGIGSPAHLAGELFKSMARVEMTHVPYKGGAAAVTDLTAGRVDVFFADQLLAIAQIKGGKLRPLAVTAAKRSAALPDLPTMAEAALPGYETGLWYGLFAPKSIPRDTVLALNAAAKRVLSTPEARDSIRKQGGEALASSPEELQAVVVGEIAKWRKLTKTLGIKLEQ